MSRHGTASRYTNDGCRCPHCRRAWRESAAARSAMSRWRARNLAAGLNADGALRKRPYDQRSLALMAEHGLEPEPRWMP